MRSSARASLSAALAAVLLTGCGLGGSDEGGTSPSSSADQSQASSGSSGSSSAGDGLDQAARDAGIDPKNPPKPVATVPLAIPGAKGEKPAAFDLLGLERKDDLMLLTASVTIDASSTGDAQDFFGWFDRRWYPQVIDTRNLKVHDVVTADDQRVMSDTGALTQEVGPGQTLYLFAAFAAPPQDVSTVTVRLTDNSPAIQGVKVQ